VPFLMRRGVPVFQNVLLPTERAARGIARGDLEMCACPTCGFVFNAVYDPALVAYGPSYENCQDHSPAFIAYLDQLAEYLVAGCGVTAGRVVEIGCGKGTFLRKLVTHSLSQSEGVGYDPSFTTPTAELGGRLRFVPDFYGPGTALPADAVVCRHVIEHLPEPLELLRTVRAAVGASGETRAYFETPCAEWILRNRVMWDFFYEHCSVFTPPSIRLALERSGFAVRTVRHVFGEQYLWAEGGTTGSVHSRAADGSAVVRLARAFAAEERERLAGWRRLLTELCPRGAVYAWGAGAKGVTFCNLADPDASRLAGVVDVNPNKQGKFLPGTGHPIVPPEAVAGAAAVLVFNPNYLSEIRAAVERISPGAAVIDPMREATPCGS
jgi:SAM-dependent methyltransferase